MISIDIHSTHFNSEFNSEVDFNDINLIDWKALIKKSLLGEKISVKKAGVEVLQITPVTPTLAEPNESKREFGLLRGKITVPSDSRWGDDEVQAMFDESLNKGVP